MDSSSGKRMFVTQTHEWVSFSIRCRKRSATNSSGLKLTGSPGPHAPSVKLVQQGQGGFVGDEKVEPPSTRWVSFHAVEEAAEAVLHQSLAESVAVSVCSPVGGTPRLHHSPNIRVAWCRRFDRRNMDGAEVGQKVGGKGSEVGHLAGI